MKAMKEKKALYNTLKNNKNKSFFKRVSPLSFFKVILPVWKKKSVKKVSGFGSLSSIKKSSENKELTKK